MRIIRKKPTSAVLTPAPLNTGAPVIAAGNTNVGTVASLSNGSWSYSPTTYTRRWYRNGVLLGSTGPTRTFVAADEGFLITADVIAKNTTGDSLPKMSNAFGPITTVQVGAPVNTAAPTVTAANTNVGTIATLSNGTWTNSPTSYTRRWYDDGIVIPGATGSTYTFATSNVGAIITGDVTADNGTPSAPQVSNDFGPVTSAAPAAQVPVNTGLPVITAPSFVVGATATLSAGTWNNASTYTREWFREGNSVPISTATQYTFVAADAGLSMTGKVVASNATGSSTPATSNPVGPIQAASTSTFTLDSTVVEINLPKVLTPLNNNGNIISANMPTDTCYLTDYTVQPPNGFMFRSSDNTIQWTGMTNETAGTVVVSLTDASGATANVTVTKLMRLHHSQIETNALGRCGVGFLMGVPEGSTATMSDASGYFELRSYTNTRFTDGLGYTPPPQTLWWVRRKAANGSTVPTSLPLGTYTVSFSCTGVQTVSATITVVADTGATQNLWPDPALPNPPLSPLATAEAGKSILSGDRKVRQEYNAPSGSIYIQGAYNIDDVVISDFTGNGCGQMFELNPAGGYAINNLRIQRVKIINGYVASNGQQGVFTGQQHKHTNTLFEDIDYHSTDMCYGANAINACLQVASKRPDRAYGGNFIWRRIKSDGMRMSNYTKPTATYPNGQVIDFPNSDGVAAEPHYTQLGPARLEDLTLLNQTDAGVDWKATNTFGTRIKVDGCRECFKDWATNIWEFLKLANPTTAHFFRMGQEKRIQRTYTVIRQLYCATAARPACKFETASSALMVQKWHLQAGQTELGCNLDAKGAVLVRPDGLLLVAFGSDTFTTVNVP